ncbi:MAG: hypothetical protein CM15mP89_3780 [Gammaproteobacteria bacterium]|nr:MAG: hypothetical protein CM15mP89_3780 [Gammaproteobacteria bacterium]
MKTGIDPGIPGVGAGRKPRGVCSRGGGELGAYGVARHRHLSPKRSRACPDDRGRTTTFLGHLCHESGIHPFSSDIPDAILVFFETPLPRAGVAVPQGAHPGTPRAGANPQLSVGTRGGYRVGMSAIDNLVKRGGGAGSAMLNSWVSRDHGACGIALAPERREFWPPEKNRANKGGAMHPSRRGRGARAGAFSPFVGGLGGVATADAFFLQPQEKLDRWEPR